MAIHRWTELGRGATATVSLATADSSARLFAVKSARHSAAPSLLRREHAILSTLHSPYIISDLGFHDARDAAHLFLELASGGSLADVVGHRGGSLDEDSIRLYARDIARGLAYIHGVSLVHGDVKGRNVLVGRDGVAKIADFGCAAYVDRSSPAAIGTPAYMAPEAARGERQGTAADVWALGCTVIEMATGRAPWPDIDHLPAAVHRIGFSDAVPETPASLSEDGRDFLGKCLRRDARERWTAKQLLEHPYLAGELPRLESSPTSVLQQRHLSWESAIVPDETEDHDDGNAAERISSLAAPCFPTPAWACHDCDSWIRVRGTSNTGDHSEEACPS